MVRAFPVLATALVALAHALAWRSAFGVSAWVWIAMFYAPVSIVAYLVLAREEVLGTLLRPVAGDAARGIGSGAAGLVALYGLALAALHFFPVFVTKDLYGIIRVAAAAPTAVRATAIILFSVVEEIVWRGAVAHALESRVGSKRAPWIASALFVVSVVPSLHASLIAAAVILGTITAWLRARLGRLSVPIVVHAVFTWITVEMILPTLWEKVR
jgi:membrane protease YdiL (CAAX protease family)